MNRLALAAHPRMLCQSFIAHREVSERTTTFFIGAFVSNDLSLLGKFVERIRVVSHPSRSPASP
jgi:hypothetical protein